jgi:hypothetical protein
MPIGDVSLDGAEVDWLWDRRNQIVHNRPLVVDEDTLSAVPAELRSTAILSESTVERLIQLTSRTHLHSTGMFLSYSMTYQKELVGALVEAWYPENGEE